MHDDPKPGDTVRARLPDGSTRKVRLTSYGLGGFLGVVEGETTGRRITRWMITAADPADGGS